MAQASTAPSDTGASKLNIQPDIEQAKKPEAGSDQADQILTNPMLRAQTGSLSTFSVTTALGYNAGSVAKPLDVMRPNISGSNQNQTTLNSLGGSIGLKYRLGATDSLTVAGGLRMITPFNSTYASSDPAAQKMFNDRHGVTDFNNPALTYTHLFVWGPTQNFVNVNQTYNTDAGQRSVGYATNTNLSHTVAYPVGDTGITAEWVSSATYFLFDKPQSTPVVNADGSSGTMAASQTEYEIDFLPTLEYRLTDSLNLRTQLQFAFEHSRNLSNATTFRVDKVFQTVGVGISLGRNIFLFPNVQFLPDDIRADRTNLALSTNINLF